MTTAEEIRRSLIAFFITESLPFRAIESPHLRRICPDLPTAKALSEIVESQAKKVKEEIITILQGAKTISIHIDKWSSKTFHHYLGVCVTCSLADEKLHTFTLECKHTEVAAIMMQVIQEYKLDHRIVQAVTDSEPINPKAFDLLGIVWRPCLCHVLNLLCGSFLKSVKLFLDPTLELAGKLHKSNKWRAFIDQTESTLKMVPSYIETRWYSVTNLLEAIVQL